MALVPGKALADVRYIAFEDSEVFCSSLQSAQHEVHSRETFPHSRAPICSLIRGFEQGKIKEGLQAKVSLLLKTYIPNGFPLIFSYRFPIRGTHSWNFFEVSLGAFEPHFNP